MFSKKDQVFLTYKTYRWGRDFCIHSVVHFLRACGSSFDGYRFL